MPELDDAARDLRDHPVRPPLPVDVLARRVRVRRKRRRVRAVLAAGVLATAAVVGGLVVTGGQNNSPRVVVGAPNPDENRFVPVPLRYQHRGAVASLQPGHGLLPAEEGTGAVRRHQCQRRRRLLGRHVGVHPARLERTPPDNLPPS
jgi:hypothetical protein